MYKSYYSFLIFAFSLFFFSHASATGVDPFGGGKVEQKAGGNEGCNANGLLAVYFSSIKEELPCDLHLKVSRNGHGEYFDVDLSDFYEYGDGNYINYITINGNDFAICDQDSESDIGIVGPPIYGFTLELLCLDEAGYSSIDYCGNSELWSQFFTMDCTNSIGRVVGTQDAIGICCAEETGGETPGPHQDPSDPTIGDEMISANGSSIDIVKAAPEDIKTKMTYTNESVEVQVYDLNGQLIYNDSFDRVNNESIFINDINYTGICIVVVLGDNSINTKKVFLSN